MFPKNHMRPKNWSYEDSHFWKVIQRHPRLTAAMDDIVTGALYISQYVAAELPDFTLHDKVHLDNVLYWMDQLVTPRGLDSLGPTGCAFCIVLAYVHDLGMVPEPGWKLQLQDSNSEESKRLRRWAVEHHPDLLDLRDYNRRREQEGESQAEWIDAFIRLDYLRATHADPESTGRVARHLRNIWEKSSLKSLFGFLGPDDVAIELVAEVAASHNQAANWLSRRHQRRDGLKVEGVEGSMNIVLPAMLLRLADICDFDRSRTPPILFRQLGLEGFSCLALDGAQGDKQIRAKVVSTQEWMKHLAVDRWYWDDEVLCYVATRCPHPVVEKVIRHFCAQIAHEVQSVREELHHLSPLGKPPAWIRLPREVEPKITASGYHFEDLTFRLETNEITRLLMGTGLYGNPELCIRELLQNALDAVQLRDLRWQLKEKLGDAPDWLHVDRWLPEERKSPIHLEWGVDRATGREWISVRDSGVGMTLGQIKKYLATLGSSYYRSPDFTTEEHRMRENGLIPTPLSQFGIGILSCFMVADSIELYTCPCEPDADERQPYHVRVTGPGALFHFRKWSPRAGEHPRPGTEVRLRLKQGFRLVYVSPPELLAQLAAQLGYVSPEAASGSVCHERTENGIILLNPAAVAARHVIWPRYPIDARPEGESGPTLVLQDEWHFRELCPLDGTHLSELANQWGIPTPDAQVAHWDILRWTDDHRGSASTGSRICVALPSVRPRLGDAPPPTETRLPPWVLFPLAEAGLARGLERRRILVGGMYVKTVDEDVELALCQPAVGLGTWIWIDLCGAAKPRLSADRKEASRPLSANGEEWERVVSEVIRSWTLDQAKWIKDDSRAGRAFQLGVAMCGSTRDSLKTTQTADQWDMEQALAVQPEHPISAMASLAAASLAAEVSVIREVNARSHRSCLVRDQELQPDMNASIAFDHRAFLPKEHEVLERAWDLALEHTHRTRPFVESVELGDVRRKRALILAQAVGRVRTLGRVLMDNVGCHLVNEGFWPSLGEAFPLLGLPARSEGFATAAHIGPAVIGWDAGGPSQEPISSLGFDSCLPSIHRSYATLARPIPGLVS